MNIERALDWDKVSIDLKRNLQQSGYNPDLEKMFKNIDKMVTELSKLEVSFRRIHKCHILDDKVAEINNAINHLEKFILISHLMK